MEESNSISERQGNELGCAGKFSEHAHGSENAGHPFEPTDTTGHAEGSAPENNPKQPSRQPSYEVRAGKLYRVESDRETCLSNFTLKIVAEHVRTDEDLLVRRDFLLEMDLNGKTVRIPVPSDEFYNGKLVTHIAAGAGSEAIIYASHKDLRIAAQELSPMPVPLKTITTSMGFNHQGVYLAPGMLISAQGINLAPEIDLDLSEGNFSRHLGFLPPVPEHVLNLLHHLHGDFLQLKGHNVGLPLNGPHRAVRIRKSNRRNWKTEGCHAHARAFGQRQNLHGQLGSFILWIIQ